MRKTALTRSGEATAVVTASGAVAAPRVPPGLWSPGMLAVMLAQFLSALADNALLFGALALLRIDRYPDWSAPLLQEFFVGAYIILAPFVGPAADAVPKGRVMVVANTIKVIGALGMCLGLNPFLAYGLVGAGAAAYSPAKYGILAELVLPARLVQANGLMESATIAAILIGAIAGGALADWSVPGTLAMVTGCYCAATAANLLVPRLAPAHPLTAVSMSGLMREFFAAVRVLVKVPDARFTMIGTSLFWGAGSTLRFLLVAWVPIALGITTNAMPAYLNGMVAVGIVVGAALAAKFVTLETPNRALPAGVLIGLAVCLLAITKSVPAAFVIVAIVGAGGGFFIVPLNALLQHRGRQSVGTGHAIAIQNLAENGLMLLMVGLYTLVVRAGTAIPVVAAGFGSVLSIAIALLWLSRRGLPRATAVAR